eukprot:g6508.t1
MRECASLRAEPQELQLEIEQQTSMRTQAALQRNKQDAEEKRTTISHQQEQERRTAEYKARLDSELYQSKLEEPEVFLGFGKMFGKPLSPEVVEEMHFAFIYAEEHHDSCTPQNVQTVWKWCEQDGAADALNAWKRFCDMLKETEKILGAIDAPQLLLKHGASVTSGDITVFMGEQAVKVGSIVEFIVRRSSMLIMLGTGFKMPKYLDSVQKYISTARTPSASAPEVPDMARALELLVHAGALPTEKSQEEGSDLGRAAYFLDTTLANTSSQRVGKLGYFGKLRGAVIAALLGISQLKHRLNRALLQQPRMAGKAW